MRVGAFFRDWVEIAIEKKRKEKPENEVVFNLGSRDSSPGCCTWRIIKKKKKIRNVIYYVV